MITDKQKAIIKAGMKKRFPSFFKELSHELQQEKNRADLAKKTKKRIDDYTN